MKGLLLKDYYNLKSAIALYTALVVGFIAFGVVSKRYILLPIVPILIFSTMLSGTFTKDKNASWNRLAVTTPIKKNEIVGSKYLLFLIIIAVSLVFSGIVSVIAIMNEGLKSNATIELSLLSVSITLYAGSISLYCLNKSDSMIEKMEMLTVVSYLAASGIAIGLLKLLGNVITNRMNILILELLISVLCIIVSYKLAISAFRKRDLG